MRLRARHLNNVFAFPSSSFPLRSPMVQTHETRPDRYKTRAVRGSYRPCAPLLVSICLPADSSSHLVSPS